MIYERIEDIPRMSLDYAPHFSHSESRCKCGECEQDLIIPELVWLLEITRGLYGKAMRVNSWNRCEKHNIAVGGVLNSSHVLGYAVDIVCIGDGNRYALINSALNAGFPIMKVYKTFIHFDVNPHKTWHRISI